MSIILKALKKLEQEKLEKGAGQSEIAFDILKASPRSRRPGILPAIVSVALLAVVLAAAVLYGVSFQKPVHGNNSVSLPPLPEMVAAGEAPPPTKEAPSPIGVVPDPMDPPTPSRVDSPLEPPAIDTSRDSRVRGATAAAEPDRSENVPDGRWTLSGIAWGDDEEARLAVINGMPVATGEVIGDATVASIEEDRVILSYRGESLPVLLDSPGGN